MNLAVYRCPTCGKVFHFPSLSEKRGRFQECCPECGEDELTEGYVCPICGDFHEGIDIYCEKCKDYVQNDLVQMMVEVGSFINTDARNMVGIVEAILATRFNQTRAYEGLQERIERMEDEYK